MNSKQKEILKLSSVLGMSPPTIKSLTFCPWCHSMTLMLHEHKYHYSCSSCEREGCIREVRNKVFEKLMQEKRGVNI